MLPIVERLEKIENLLRNKSTDKWLNLMQACSAVAKSSGGANHNAIVAAARALGAACAGAGPPTDLYARAAALERKYFGRSDAIVLPADFPATLKVAGL